MEDQAQRLRHLVKGINEKSEDRGCKIITVTSGKGGVGKTSFTVNFALALAKLGKSVVIIDADFGFSNVNLLLGKTPKYDMGHVVRGEKRLDEVIEICFERVRYISGGAGVDELMNIPEEKLKKLIAQLVVLEKNTDYIFFDTAAGMDNAILKLIDASDETILLLTPEPTSIMDAYVVLKSAASLSEKPQIRILVNKVRSEQEAVTTVKNFSSVVNKFLNYDLNLLGYISNDETVTRSISALIPHYLNSPNSISTRQTEQIAAKYINIVAQENRTQGFRRFLSRFIRRKDN